MATKKKKNTKKAPSSLAELRKKYTMTRINIKAGREKTPTPIKKLKNK
ncbi:hypothetical protein KKG65_00120 [Patescibacteria group bacterium]|nr:hypothetical protein [Patescibacteria group bacterium]